MFFLSAEHSGFPLHDGDMSPGNHEIIDRVYPGIIGHHPPSKRTQADTKVSQKIHRKKRQQRPKGSVHKS